MPNRTLLLLLIALLTAACEPTGEEVVPAQETHGVQEPAAAESAAPHQDTLPPAIAARLREVERPPRSTRWDAVPVEVLARSPAASVCQRFARRAAELTLRFPDDPVAFLQALREEVIGAGGTDDPFELERGLREGRWNREYFYAGHGGFRPEFDDAERYPSGGNHQAGHFTAVLSIAARFGQTPALIALAQAGDYNPGEEDDLRLSLEAIDLGVGLAQQTLSPADVARRVRGLCRE